MYHLWLMLKPEAGRGTHECRLDLTEEELQERYLVPYREGRSILINGRCLSLRDIDRVVIRGSAESAHELGERFREAQELPEVDGSAYHWEGVRHYAADVTNDLVTGPPGSEAQEPAQESQGDPEDPSIVFVVHGRDESTRSALLSFLRAVGLKPLEWAQAVAATGEGTPYIGRVLEVAFAKAAAVVVLMTPDDEGRLREQFRQDGDKAHDTQLTPQARLNVIFEAGMAMGIAPKRTIIVETGELRPFTDIVGRHVVRFGDSSESRKELAERLGTAGCAVDLSGTDWLTAGTTVEP